MNTIAAIYVDFSSCIVCKATIKHYTDSSSALQFADWLIASQMRL